MNKFKPSSFLFQFDSIGAVKVFVREDGSMFIIEDEEVANLELSLILNDGKSVLWELYIDAYEALKDSIDLSAAQTSIMIMLKGLNNAYYNSLEPQHPVEVF